MKKIGILGGGQLGKMFQENASSYPVLCYYMDKAGAPVSTISAQFTVGDITDYDDVMSFGEDKDVISIEIENVNLKALRDLEAKGKTVIPSPDCLEIITDKGLQKDFYKNNEIASTPYELHDDWDELQTNLRYPLYQKYRKGGYDGKGVAKIADAAATRSAHKTPSVFEEAADINYEIAVQVFKDHKGYVQVYPVVKFVADPELNLLDTLMFPADVPHEVQEVAQAMATEVAKNLPGAGVFSVEMFVTYGGEVLLNETAPRVHNSGHSTIEASSSSQFDQMLRILLGYPLARATHRLSAIWNLVGSADFSGPCKLAGIEDVLQLGDTYLHWYHKSESKPGRKLGHLCFLGQTEADILYNINKAKETLKIIPS